MDYAHWELEYDLDWNTVHRISSVIGKSLPPATRFPTSSEPLVILDTGIVPYSNQTPIDKYGERLRYLGVHFFSRHGPESMSLGLGFSIHLPFTGRIGLHNYLLDNSITVRHENKNLQMTYDEYTHWLQQELLPELGCSHIRQRDYSQPEKGQLVFFPPR